MSRFHKPPFSSSAIVLILLYIGSSLATPVAPARFPRFSIIAASAPVHIIPAGELGPDLKQNGGGGVTTYEDNGETAVTNFENPGHSVERRRTGHITSVSEPVNIISTDEFEPDVKLDGSGGTTTYPDNGDTTLTTFNIPKKRDDKKRRFRRAVSAATAPVNIIPINSLPPGQVLTDGHSNSTNDGTTFTTNFYRNAPPSQKQSTSSLNLITPQTNDQSLALASDPLNTGLNCRGSVVMCIGANNRGVMHTLRDYMYAIPAGYRYYDGQNIACMKHTAYPYGWITWGFYCAFMQGNIPANGFDGAEVQLKMQQMIEHHCLGCGSVPFSADNDPNTAGVLVVNYVRQSECEGLCYYVPPGTAADKVEVPKGMTLASE